MSVCLCVPGIKARSSQLQGKPHPLGPDFLFVFNESRSFKMHPSCPTVADTLFIFILYIVPPMRCVTIPTQSTVKTLKEATCLFRLLHKTWRQGWDSNHGLFVSLTNPLNHCTLWLPGLVPDWSPTTFHYMVCKGWNKLTNGKDYLYASQRFLRTLKNFKM